MSINHAVEVKHSKLSLQLCCNSGESTCNTKSVLCYNSFYDLWHFCNFFQRWQTINKSLRLETQLWKKSLLATYFFSINRISSRKSGGKWLPPAFFSSKLEKRKLLAAVKSFFKRTFSTFESRGLTGNDTNILRNCQWKL